MRGGVLVGVGLALLCLLPRPAKADLRLCNRTSYVLDAATQTVVKNNESLIQGWLHVMPGNCAVAIKGYLNAAGYRVYARSSRAHAGPARAWGGKFPVCVKDGAFALRQTAAPSGCTEPDSFAVPFAPVEIKNREEWTMALDETPALPSLMAAQLAGVKRLLGDNGYKVGAIDGLPSKATQAALNDFRKKMNFKPGDGNDLLFAALEKQALTKAAPQGYGVCNDTNEPLMAAIADGGAKPASRGWWRIGPQSCAEVLTAKLGANPVYLFAQNLDGRVLVGGADKFCITSIVFEAEGRTGCAKRGMTEAGFAKTAGKGAPGFIAHIGDNGLAR